MKSLVFVYAADSGKLNALLDSAHKLLSPSTYACRICQLTHGMMSEKKQWTDFIKQLELPAEFLHRDELKKRYPALANAELKGCADLDALIALVREKLKIV